jgi:hypothetical protein
MDESAKAIFAALGYGKPSGVLTKAYFAFKRKKDVIQPGKLSAEGYAFVATLADLAEGKLLLAAKE